MAFYLAAIMIVVAVALFVAAPLVEGARPRRRIATPERERQEHLRALAVQGLRELEFDHEMGKLDEGDYLTLKRTLEDRALSAMTALDRIAAPPSSTLAAAPVMPEPAPSDPFAPPSANRSIPVMPGLDPGIPRAAVPDASPHAAAARPELCPRCGGGGVAPGAGTDSCPACGAAGDPSAAARAG